LRKSLYAFFATLIFGVASVVGVSIASAGHTTPKTDCSEFVTQGNRICLDIGNDRLYVYDNYNNIEAQGVLKGTLIEENGSIAPDPGYVASDSECGSREGFPPTWVVFDLPSTYPAEVVAIIPSATAPFSNVWWTDFIRPSLASIVLDRADSGTGYQCIIIP
jgi:hypothetical protein